MPVDHHLRSEYAHHLGEQHVARDRAVEDRRTAHEVHERDRRRDGEHDADDSAETEGRIAYLGEAPAAQEQSERRAIPRIMTAATAGMVAISVGLTVFAGPLYAMCDRIGQALLEPISLVELGVVEEDS